MKIGLFTGFLLTYIAKGQNKQTKHKTATF